LRRIRWAPTAADDLEQIRNYQQEHYPSRALSTVSTLYKAARSLKQFPYRGRKGEVEGTRELVMASLPYIIVYGIEPQMIHIFRVIHAAQDWPTETL
jgi:toxin ParE1/3/4